MSQCNNKDGNMEFCTCSYPGCPRKGVCCECISYHREQNQLPGCVFPPEAEKTYDRSLDYFLRVHKGKKG